MENSKQNNTIASLGVDIQITPTSALYLFLCLALAAVAFFTAKKYIR